MGISGIELVGAPDGVIRVTVQKDETVKRLEVALIPAFVLSSPKREVVMGRMGLDQYHL